MERAPVVIGPELASRARRLRPTEPANLAVVIDQCVGHRRIAALGLALRARLLLNRDAVLARNLTKRVEVHRARIEQGLIDTIRQVLTPGVLVELIDSEARSARTGTRAVHVVREVVWFKDSESHLAHDLVVRALENPVLEPVITSRLAGYEIDVRDGDMRVRVPAVRIQMHDDVTRTVRRDLLRERVGRVSDDLWRCRIVRVELVSRERLDHHQGLVLAPRPLEHRLDLDDRVVRVTEVRAPRSRARLLDVGGPPVVRVDDRRSGSRRRRLFRNAHDASSFTTRSSAVVASSRRATAGAAPANP